MHLGAFLYGVGHHLAAWRHASVDPRAGGSFEHFKQLAQLAERGAFDALFLADNVGLSPAPSALLSRAGPPAYYFDPLMLLASLATVTERIGLVATVSASYLPPFHLARKFASLDHLSHGRTGWNLVTSGTDWEARNFGFEHQLSHAVRYERAAEYVKVVKALWDSWEDQPTTLDDERTRYLDPHKLHRVEHRGEYFKVQGALQIERPIQGYPVLVQAGSSSDGQGLAAATAELVFTAQQSLEGAQAFYRGLKGQVVAAGRSPDAVKILPGIMPILGDTDAAARAEYEYLQSLLDPALCVGLLSAFLGNVDLSGYPLDGPFPDLPLTEGWQSRHRLFSDLARRDKLTLGQLATRAASARGHWVVVGSAKTIVDQMEQWFVEGAADGFNILAPTLPAGLEAFVTQVIPELRRRGLFRDAYRGNTLREHLGLARPPHPLAHR
ncbi:MAG: LLM class flavin-dependent oxidoreductase [Janthinobacterium lividum]